jgi:hypothetical protein
MERYICMDEKAYVSEMKKETAKIQNINPDRIYGNSKQKADRYDYEPHRGKQPDREIINIM